MAVEGRQPKPQSRPSPLRRGPYGGYGDGRDSRPRSRSPIYGRDGREPRDSRDTREPRPGGPPRDHDDRYRGSESREKDPRGNHRADPRGDPRGDPREDPAFREEFDRYYRGAAAPDDYYRKKEDPYRDSFRDPWNGRRDPESDRGRPEDHRRNELYRQYFEELQRRYDTERPVDCSVIVVNKAQKEYAETVGRKVRDLGMVVDLIFLNTEVSLTQALEDVGRARTPFAIIITQQHQVHRSCTVNILFGTPQEHRNMPMQDAMVLVAHNYDTYKVENREKEREEIARKAAKMADDVLVREADREAHPISLLTAITLLSENRFVTPEELDSLIAYLKDKRLRLVGTSADPHAAAIHLSPVAPHHDPHPPHAHPIHAPIQQSHTGLPPSSAPQPNPNQQELQAKILSLFNSGAGASVPSSAPPPGASPMAPQPQAYASMAPQHPPPSMSHSAGLSAPSQNPQMLGGGRSSMPPTGPPPPAGASGYGMPPGRGPTLPLGQRPPSSASGINFDSPSVQKALDTLIQSGPSLNHLVSPQQQQAPPPRGPPPPMSMYPRHY